MPAPPQVWPPEQPPQSIWPPQPLPTMPQYLPLACTQRGRRAEARVGGAAAHAGMPAPPQVCPAGQPPQSILPPHPSPTMPQYLPLACVQLAGVHPIDAAQVRGCRRRRKLCPAGQPPQSILPPQPSPTTPQYLPFGRRQTVGVHAPESGAAPHTLEIPPRATVER